MVDESVSEDAIIRSANIASYTEQVFRMYGGPTVDVVLQFDRSLIGAVYDKFGEDTQMICSGKDSLVATV